MGNTKIVFIDKQFENKEAFVKFVKQLGKYPYTYSYLFCYILIFYNIYYGYT